MTDTEELTSTEVTPSEETPTEATEEATSAEATEEATSAEATEEATPSETIIASPDEDSDSIAFTPEDTSADELSEYPSGEDS